jgi:hypothetical protein
VGYPFSNFQADFLDVSLNAIATLFVEGKQNIVHCISECFTRSTETRMPMNRMPFGLVDNNILFFAAMKIQKLGIIDHYARWTETMFAHFSHKWGYVGSMKKEWKKKKF